MRDVAARKLMVLIVYRLTPTAHENRNLLRDPQPSLLREAPASVDGLGQVLHPCDKALSDDFRRALDGPVEPKYAKWRHLRSRWACSP